MPRVALTVDGGAAREMAASTARFRRLPLTAERVRAALAQAKGRKVAAGCIYVRSPHEERTYDIPNRLS